jgi:predicted aminopeptidase
LLGGCANPAYYWQAVSGQFELLRLARPIEDARADTETPPWLREKLDAARRIRDFASSELGLPANGSFRRYADLQRPYVVWNVFAAEELSVRLKEWCYPVAGCVSYRGYFAEQAAQEYAEELRRQGHDVHVTGVPAYSTLGWFDDPLLNTFIHYPEAELARLIFHELAHQVAYVKDDSEFNESFAVAVEQAGVARWLARHGNDAQRGGFAAMQRYRSDFTGLVLQYRDRLEAAYSADAPDEEKRRQKAAILAALQEQYRRIKTQRWSGFSGYDRWFGQNINNATLASIGIYTRLVPPFEALLARHDNDLPRFYEAVKALAKLPAEERQAQLEPMDAAGQAAGAPVTASR